MTPEPDRQLPSRDGHQVPAHGISLREATRVWGYIGLNSFGGPAGQIAVMHRELVDRRKWISERRFLHSLNFCMILPGPEAQQLAIYIGWLMHGVLGGVIAGSLFLIPGVLAMMLLAISYALFGTVTWVAGLLFGIQAAVVAIVAEAVARIGKRTLRTRFLQLTAAISFIAIFFFAIPFPLIIIVTGMVGWLVGRSRPEWFPLAHPAADEGPQSPALLRDDEVVDRQATRRSLIAAGVCAVLWLIPVALLVSILGTSSVYTQEALVFSTSAVVTFGGAYAVLGFVTQQAVDRYGWIGTNDMITGLGLAETTPGPLILVVQFVGFLAAYSHPGSLPPIVAGLLGATVTLWVTFVPCFFFIFLGAPYIERLRDNHAIRNALAAVSAAVAGVVLDLAIWFAINTAFASSTEMTFGPIKLTVPDPASIRPASIAISILAAVLVFGLKIGTLRVLAVAAAMGTGLAVFGLT